MCCDTAGDYEEAIRLYTRSLDHFLAAIQCMTTLLTYKGTLYACWLYVYSYKDKFSDEQSEDRKDALRAKVAKYMSRAEELKSLLRDGRPRIATKEELIPCQQLSKLKITSHPVTKLLAH